MMKTKMLTMIAVSLLLSILFPAVRTSSQVPKSFEKKYLKELPHGKPDDTDSPQKYRMTAIYLNRDLYGNFTGKTKVTGDYTRGLENGYVSWSNIFISGSNSISDPFPQGVRQEYMENMRYVPSEKMLIEKTFKDFPASVENVLARNLIWDMQMIEEYAWFYLDSLELNRNYTILQRGGEFDMADIGKYEQNSIQLCWAGITLFNEKLCAVIEYRAVDNMIKLTMDQIQSRGTEQYWGTTWISMESRQIEHAEMYGGTIQEIEVKGLKDKFLAKTIRELWVDRIQ